MKNNNKIKWPGAIYFDTNSLLKLITRGCIPKISDQIEIDQKYDINYYAPRIVIDEVVNKRSRDLKKIYEEINERSKRIGHILKRAPLQIEPLDNMDEVIQAKIKEFVVQSNISILKLPNIPLGELINMAINKIAPFEEKGEKGFRDSIIVFSILEHMKENTISNAIFITEDNIFQEPEVINRFTDTKLSLIFSTDYEDAIDKIIEIFNKLNDVDLKRKNEEILNYLNTIKNDIFDFVLTNANVSRYYLESNWETDEEKLKEYTVEKILDVRPVEISKIKFDEYGIYRKFREDVEPPEGYELIRINVKTEFEILATSILDWFRSQPRVPLKDYDKHYQIKYQLPDTKYISLKLYKNIPVLAWISSDKNKERKIIMKEVETY